VDRTEPAFDIDASFTLDAALLAQRKAASARRVYAIQIPAIRAAGFAIICVVAKLQGSRMQAAFAQSPLAIG
jgi:hypothetical protein